MSTADRQSLSWQAKDELLKTFSDKEKENGEVIERRERAIEDQRKKVKALKRYGREVKYLAEDWAPRGKPLPDILALPPPVSLEDDQDDDYMRRQHSEIDRLKNRNRILEDDIRKLSDVRPNASVSVEAKAAPMYDRSAQNTIRGGGVNSVAISTNSLDKQSTLEENRKKEALLREHQAEVDMLKVKIRDMEYELKQ